MKKNLLVFVVLSFVFVFLPLCVRAESVEVVVRNSVNTGNSVRQEIRQEVRSEGQNIDTKIRTKITETNRERIRIYLSNAVSRIEALINRLTNLVSRIEERIELINQQGSGLDTTSASSLLSDAKENIDSVSTQLSSLKTLTQEVLEEEEPQGKFKDVVKSINKIKADLIDIHKDLVSAVIELKKLYE